MIQPGFSDRIKTPLQLEGPSHKLAALELIRFVAAAWVVIIHVCLTGSGSRIERLILATGHLPVVVFFVLSGFVIGLRHAGRSNPWAPYLRARFVRIYPLFLLALAFAGLVQLLLSATPPHPAALPSSCSIGVLLGNVFMVQAPTWWGVRWCVPPFANAIPLWTLSLEWWFYLAFWAVNERLPARIQTWSVNLVGLLAALALSLMPVYPFFWAALFVLWWAGLGLAKEWSIGGRLTIARQWPGLVTLAAIAGVPALLRHSVMPGGMARGSELALDVVSKHCIEGVAVVIAALLFQNGLFRWRCGTSALVAKLGAASYAIYALHMPVVLAIRRLSSVGTPVALLVALFLTFLIAWAAEFAVQPRIAAGIKKIWHVRGV